MNCKKVGIRNKSVRKKRKSRMGIENETGMVLTPIDSKDKEIYSMFMVAELRPSHPQERAEYELVQRVGAISLALILKRRVNSSCCHWLLTACQVASVSVDGRHIACRRRVISREVRFNCKSDVYLYEL
ncbi:hypothetical protein EVAR_59721_1 [Eumeta japonica]|uniref:Uncharacterized protein n=1 Tax=Eumeta variegata TaxID=151549 RepID=A0A4C1XJJ2_EUMVA|nr:hypothetical protein EVAR_59721_1 [Eumeta japonica]